MFPIGGQLKFIYYVLRGCLVCDEILRPRQHIIMSFWRHLLRACLVCDEVLRPRQHIIMLFWRRLLLSSWDYYTTIVVNDSTTSYETSTWVL